MTFGFFVLGFIMMVAGFTMVWKTSWWENNWGDIGAMVGIHGSALSSWKLAGVILMFIGFLVAFGILGALFYLLVGQYLPTGTR